MDCLLSQSNSGDPLKKFIRLLQEYATGRTVFVLFFITQIFYAVILLYTIPAVLEAAPEMKLFDMSPGGYTIEYAEKLIDAIGADGRRVYLSLQLPIDFIYPGLFAVAYTLLLTWLFKKGFAQESPIFYLALVPAVAGFFDYLENVGIILMLRSFPDLTATTVIFSSICSVIKSLFTVAFFILLLISLAAVARRKFAARSYT